MAVIDKVYNDRTYYRIGKYRAAGIIPYYIKNGEIFILINKETQYKNNKLNCIGGKVEEEDNTIYDTIVREFSEETGEILSSNELELLREKLPKRSIRIYIEESKYLVVFFKIKKRDKKRFKLWKKLPELYDDKFDGVEPYSCNSEYDSVSLHWVKAFKNDEIDYMVSEDEKVSFVLNKVIDFMKECEDFKEYK